jgi:cytochrome P450
MRERPPEEIWPGVRRFARYHDVPALFRHPGASSERPLEALPDAPPEVRSAADVVQAHLRTWLLMVDPPDHTRLRRLVSTAFTPRVVEALRRRIEVIVAELLADVRPGVELDLIERLAYPLPTRVIAELIGLPPEDADRFKSWSDDIAAAISNPGLAPNRDEIFFRARDSIDAVGTYLRTQIALRRADPPRRPAQPADRRRGGGLPALERRARRDDGAASRGWPRDDNQLDRERDAGTAQSSWPAASLALRSVAAPACGGGAASLG